MGLKIIQLESGGKLLDNYLCNMSPAEFASYRDSLPETLSGSTYLREYGLLPDTITRVVPEETYHPRACAEHPILENDRVKQFFGLMQIASMRRQERESALSSFETIPLDTETIVAAGQLMYESHASYTDRLELGSPETDLLVNLIRECGEERGLYGAKITGGGAGGTVAVLCAADSEDTHRALVEVCEAYMAQTGLMPRTVVGSSPGAIQFGTRQILRG